jgi:hypothetical protein
MRTARTLVAVRRVTRIAGARAGRLYERARRDRHRLLAAAVVIGIVFMVIHWR